MVWCWVNFIWFMVLLIYGSVCFCFVDVYVSWCFFVMMFPCRLSNFMQFVTRVMMVFGLSYQLYFVVGCDGCDMDDGTCGSRFGWDGGLLLKYMETVHGFVCGMIGMGGEWDWWEGWGWLWWRGWWRGGGGIVAFLGVVTWCVGREGRGGEEGCVFVPALVVDDLGGDCFCCCCCDLILWWLLLSAMIGHVVLWWLFVIANWCWMMLMWVLWWVGEGGSMRAGVVVGHFAEMVGELVFCSMCVTHTCVRIDTLYFFIQLLKKDL